MASRLNRSGLRDTNMWAIVITVSGAPIPPGSPFGPFMANTVSFQTSWADRSIAVIIILTVVIVQVISINPITDRKNSTAPAVLLPKSRNLIFTNVKWQQVKALFQAKSISASAGREPAHAAAAGE